MAKIMDEVVDPSISIPDGSSKDDILLEKLNKWLREAEDSVSEIEYRKRSKISYDAYADRPDTQEVLDKLAEQSRPPNVFNEIKPKVNMLVGMGAQLRQTPKMVPVEVTDEAVTELMNNTYKFYRTKLKVNRTEMECFEHTIKGGRAYQWYYVDTENPFSPKLKSQRVAGRDVYVDPNSVEYDMSDAWYVMRQKWLKVDEVQAFWPEFNPEEIQGLSKVSSTYTPTYFLSLPDLYRVIECWYRVVIKYKWFISPITGKPDKVKALEWPIFVKKLKEGIKIPDPKTGEVKTIQLDEPPEAIERMVKEVRYAIFSSGILLEQGDDPIGKGVFPVVQYGAYKDEDNNTWDSVIKAMIDPQNGLDTVLRQLIHLLQVSPKPILMAEIGQIINEQAYREDSSSPNFILDLAQGALTGNKVRFSDQPAISPVYTALIDVFKQTMKDVSGVQDSLLGIQTTSREPGVTVQLRQQSALAVLYSLFSNFRESRIHGATILMGFIQKYVPDDTMIRIEGSTQLIQLTKQSGDSIRDTKFDIVVDEELENSTMRLATAKMLTEIEQARPGSIPPDIITSYLPLPLTAKMQIREYNDAKAKQDQERFDQQMEIEKLKITSKTKQTKK